MAEQTFRSPGFFEKEIDLSARKVGPIGTPAGIVGTAERGPAFVPVTVGSYADFETRLGGLDPNRFGPYAVREFLKNRSAVTYLRVLGAGANDTAVDMSTTSTNGTVKNAGFKLIPAQNDDAGGTTAPPTETRNNCKVQFICGRHNVDQMAMNGYPMMIDNDSCGAAAADEDVNLVRGMVMVPNTAKMMIMGGGTSHDFTATGGTGLPDYASLGAVGGAEAGTFKLIISSSLGKPFSEGDGHAGIRILTASLDPTNRSYIGKVLNRDPHKFVEMQHYLYADFAVEDEVASIVDANDSMGGTASVAILNGHPTNASDDTPLGSDDEWEKVFGRFDTRYTTPTTPWVISQPFGGTEYKLFRFETISDGAYGNDKLKVSIANLRASTDPKDKHCTFEVQIRRFEDTDMNKQMVERYPDCNLDPKSDRFIAAQIGDYKVYYDFDQENPDERRLVIGGKYPNRSAAIRVICSDEVNHGDPCVPTEIMPFGFQGVPTLKTTDSLTDNAAVALMLGPDTLGQAGAPARLDGVTGALTAVDDFLLDSIIPPLPFRFKCTRGKIDDGAHTIVGQSGVDEKADSRLYWGVKFERTPRESNVTDAVLNANVSALPNPLVSAYTQFLGISKLDTMVTGSAADTFNNNKFTLARVALVEDQLSDLDSTAKSHMLGAAYIRNGVPDASTYNIVDGFGVDRVTMASIVNAPVTATQPQGVLFNRFTPFAKFTLPFSGGFDGLNILDRDCAYMNDRACSTAINTDGVNGLAAAGGQTPGLGDTDKIVGEGRQNNVTNSYNVAVHQMTDPMTVNTNILCVPGIRDAFVSDFASDRTREYSKSIYLMDLENYSEDNMRLFIGSSAHDDLKPDIRTTSENFEGRAMDNNYSSTYFPDVYIDDPFNNLKVRVPASVAAIAAMGYNDKVAYPWFAPAGFNRGALGFVSNVTTRLSAGDRDVLYDARINPIAVFPSGGFVIFGQKTLQMNKSALDRVNVRRMLLEVKRLVTGVADKILFEQNTPQTRARFVGGVTPLLALVQAQAGIEQFSVVMDDTNNTVEDYENNRLNGRIVVVPTRAIEFIAIDFIITNSGVIFA
jgi:hypothetical protein